MAADPCMTPVRPVSAGGRRACKRAVPTAVSRAPRRARAAAQLSGRGGVSPSPTADRHAVGKRSRMDEVSVIMSDRTLSSPPKPLSTELWRRSSSAARASRVGAPPSPATTTDAPPSTALSGTKARENSVPTTERSRGWVAIPSDGVAGGPISNGAAAGVDSTGNTAPERLAGRAWLLPLSRRRNDARPASAAASSRCTSA